MVRHGEGAYRQMQSELPMNSDPREITYVQCVADHVLAALGPTQQAAYRWEVTVFDSPQANAFALPGGKIGIYTGLFDMAYNQDQLAAVMAHEVGHMLAKHGNERASRLALRRRACSVLQTIPYRPSILALSLGSRCHSAASRKVRRTL